LYPASPSRQGDLDRAPQNDFFPQASQPYFSRPPQDWLGGHANVTDPISLSQLEHDAGSRRVRMAMSVAVDVGQLDSSFHYFRNLRVPLPQQITPDARIQSHPQELPTAGIEAAFRSDKL